METKKDIVKEFFEKIKEPIINKVLQETKLNPTREGRDFIKGKIQWLWQPHNIRLYFDFDSKTFNPPKQDNPTLKKLKEGFRGFSYEVKNYGSEHHFDNFYGCRVILRPNSAEVINKWYHKQWKLMSATNINDIGSQIFKVMDEMDIQCLDALKHIIGLFGGVSNYNIQKKWFKGEHGVHGVPLLDSLPEEMVITDTVFKKQYKRKVELFNPVLVKNAVSNYVMEDIAPQIENELTLIKEMVKEGIKLNLSSTKTIAYSAEHLAFVAENLRTHIPALDKLSKSSIGLNKGVKKLIGILSQTKIGDFNNSTIFFYKRKKKTKGEMVSLR